MGLPHTYGALTVGQVGVEVEVEDAQLPQVGFLLQQEAHEVAAQEAAAARHNEHQTRDGGRRLWGTNVGHGCGARGSSGGARSRRIPIALCHGGPRPIGSHS